MRINTPMIYVQRRSTISTEIIRSTSERFTGTDVLSNSGKYVTLTHTPIPETVVCVVSGMVLSSGDDRDFIVQGNQIVFSSQVLIEDDMNITIYYQYI